MLVTELTVAPVLKPNILCVIQSHAPKAQNSPGSRALVRRILVDQGFTSRQGPLCVSPRMLTRRQGELTDAALTRNVFVALRCRWLAWRVPTGASFRLKCRSLRDPRGLSLFIPLAFAASCRVLFCACCGSLSSIDVSPVSSMSFWFGVALCRRSC